MRLKKNVLESSYRKIKLKRYASSNKGTPALSRTKHCCYAAHLLNIEERTAFSNARRIVRGLENSASASLLVYSNYALQECSLLNIRYMQRPADAYNKIGTHRGYSSLIGTVLYNAIKEYYDNKTRKIIYFYSYTIENKCRTGYSNKKDIEANEREDKFAILAEKYTIDNRIIYALALTKDK
ncbi:hypothetical protein HBH42_119070 [Parastagonospora nodorum]|nr:hypothetical protein HBH42_119070 [Parastagonospora nodorum]